MKHSFPVKIQSLFADFISKNSLDMVPKEVSQRTAFEALWPQIFELRIKGFSFSQISSILGQCGLDLTTAAVELFHEEMLYQEIDASQMRMSKSVIAAFGQEEFFRSLRREGFSFQAR